MLDRLGLRPGARVLDLGCGPGLVLGDVVEPVGAQGRGGGPRRVADRQGPVEEPVRGRGRDNVSSRQGLLEDGALEPGSFDLVLARWVLPSLRGPEEQVERLARLLKHGGSWRFSATATRAPR